MSLASDREANLSLLLVSGGEEISELNADILEVRRLPLGLSLSLSDLERS